MKNLLDVMKQKETEILRLEAALAQQRKELSAIYVVLPMITEPNDPKPAPAVAKPVMATLP
jgi:hypothetical protein